MFWRDNTSSCVKAAGLKQKRCCAGGGVAYAARTGEEARLAWYKENAGLKLVIEAVGPAPARPSYEAGMRRK